MATLNQTIRERKKVFANLKKALKIVDSVLERQERLIGRVLQRKLKVPEVSDLATLAQWNLDLNGALRDYTRILKSGYPI